MKSKQICLLTARTIGICVRKIVSSVEEQTTGIVGSALGLSPI